MSQTLEQSARVSNGVKKIVTVGGGTGTFTVLKGLKKYPVHLSAIVTMSDDGGSSGRLRDEYGVLPPGDLRQCLVALSESTSTMRKLFNYRYEKGEFSGHSFGNIFISTLEHITGSLDRALDVVGKVLNIRGKVIPVTLAKTTLVTELRNGKVLRGENQLSDYQLVSKFGIKKMYLEPRVRANQKALEAIREADIVVVGPGNLYGSLVPNFLVKGIGEALAKSKAKKVLVTNLMNRHGHTDDFVVSDYVRTIESLVGKKNIFDIVVHNTKSPAKALLRTYADEGEPVLCGKECTKGPYKLIGADLLASNVAKKAKTDVINRALIRHDSDKLAKVLIGILEGKKRHTQTSLPK